MRHLRLLTDRPAVTTDTGLLALRLAVATVFIAHGWGDVFDAGVSNNVENYRDAGIPLPELSAYYTAYLQLVGGTLLALGALSRPLAAGFVIAMAGALIYVHANDPLAIQPDGSGFGFAFMMGAASLALLLTGPGRFSIDHLITSWQARSGRSVDAPSASPMPTATTRDLAR